MRLIYIANARIPTEKAHGLQIMKMCEAFALNADTRGSLAASRHTQIHADNQRQSAYPEGGDLRKSAAFGNTRIHADRKMEVVLAVPKRKNWISQDPFLYYGIKARFPIIYLPVLPLSIGFWAGNISFALSVFFWTLARRFPAGQVFYGRDAPSLFFLAICGRKVFWEMHDIPRICLWLWKFVMRRFAGIVSTNQWKAEFLQKKFGIAKEKFLVYPNGFDPAEFENLPSKEECRRELGLSQDAFIVLYTGSLYDWKGAGTFLETAKQFQEENFQFPISNFQTRKAPASLRIDTDTGQIFADNPRESSKTISENPSINPRQSAMFIFVGGGGNEVKDFRQKAVGYDNIKIIGPRPHSEIPKWLASADVLILPNSAKSEESVWATSPIKLFEYMASGKPIIASDLPSVREIVSEGEVLLVKPDDPRAFGDAILRLKRDFGLRRELADCAFVKSQNFTWGKRTEIILKFLNFTP